MKLCKIIDYNLKGKLDNLLGENYIVLDDIDGKCFCLNKYGDYMYNDCFPRTEVMFFQKQKYKLLEPTWIVKFYQYYILYSNKEPNIWFRGEKRENGNYEFDCCADTLEDIIDSL